MEPNVSDISCLGTRNRNKTAKVPNPRELIGTVHLERTRGRRSALSGRVPTGKRPSELKPSGYRGSRGRVIRALQNCDPRNPGGQAHRKIGVLGGEGTVASNIAISRYAISRHQECGATEVDGGQVAGFRDGERTVDRSTAMSHRGSENRESGGCVHIDVANPETPMESYMAAVIW
jgi:hypothetical protein